MDLSIIIVNHNEKELTNQAVQSIITSNPKIPYELIVVDSSTDFNEAYIPLGLDALYVKLVSNTTNNGFASSLNIGAGIATGRYLLFLSPNCYISANTLDESVAYLDHNPTTGSLSVKVLYPNGELNHTCKRGFPTPFNAFCYFNKIDRVFSKSKSFSGYRLSYLSTEGIHEVDAVSRHFLMIPSGLYQRLNGFDETFFFYGEDLDLCRRIQQAGYRVVYYGQSSITHLKRSSTTKATTSTTVEHLYNDMNYFYDKYYGKRYSPTMNALVKKGIKMKCNFALRNISKNHS